MHLQAQQSNPGIYFQAVARDQATNPLNNRQIHIKATILDNSINGAVLFSESHQAKTDETGVFNIAIGKGIWLTGVTRQIEKLNWSSGIHFLNLKMAVTPIAPSTDWDFNKEWIDLGTTVFGVVPYAMNLIGDRGMGIDTSILNTKLNTTDTSSMLFSYLKKSDKFDSSFVSNRVANKVNIIDTSAMLSPYAKTALTPSLIHFNTQLSAKLNTADSLLSYVTPSQLSAKTFDTLSISNRIDSKLRMQDTIYLSNRVDLREFIANKSINMNALADYTDQNYPSVKAIKDYVDNQVAMGAPDATINNRGILQLTGDLTGTSIDPRIAANAVTTTKVSDAAITDAKIASGIQATKVGLGNVTNHAQLYSFNGLTSQVQNLGTPSSTGLAPNWSSVGTTHTLNLPMANASSVTAGLISNAEFTRFNNAYLNSVTSITNNGSGGAASISGNVLNVPNYTLAGLSGIVNANQVFAGPINGGNGAAGFRALVADDIPNHAANTTGNAATSTKLLTARNINTILFDGTTDITIAANTTNALTFNNDGLGVNPSSNFNGSVARSISYNSIGAAPSIGSSNISILGTINTGVWAGTVIGANYGGAGSNNGLLKANGAGLVSSAIAGTDYMAPFGMQAAKQFYAAPNSVNGTPIFRAIEISDIPQLNQNTTGNAATASALQNNVSINGTAFNGSSDITLTANTNNNLTFSNSGSGAIAPATFNGATAKTISYNTIGAAPSNGASTINTVGTITTGTWSATVIGANMGGAGNVSGILKADGIGTVSAASSIIDYQVPLSFTAPLTNISSTIAMPQANTNTAGYISSTDWNIFNNKINATEKAAANGVATLNALGKIPTSQIPSISFSSGYVVNSESQMLALSAAVVGSIAIRTDNSRNYVLSASDPTVLSNWLQLLMPAAVSSVNGYTTGSIVLTSTDIAEGTNLYFSNARVRTAVDAFLSGEAPISYNSGTGKISMTAAATNANGYLSSTDWNTFNNKQNAFTSQAANSFFAGPSTGINASPSFRTIVVNDIPTLNQNTTGNAGTATVLQTARTINGIAFDGSANITITSAITNAVSFNNSGAGLSSPTSFDGTVAKTISYNTIGASPLIGSSALTTVGTISSGVWSASVIDAAHGGAGGTNGILKADGNGNVSAAIAGTDYLQPFGSQTSKYFYAAPNAINGAPIFRALLASDIPTLNQNTTGNSATATALQTPRTINGVAFDGTSNITIASAISNAINFNHSGTGSASPTSFDGSLAKTISYNTVGASPLAGSTSLTTLGTITSGTWNASVIGANYGGAGTISGLLKANGSGIVAAAVAGTDFESALSFSAPFARAINTISMPSATSSTNGYLSSTDWSSFNSKQTTMVAGTGVTISGGNTIAIGQAVGSASTPSFAGITLSGLNVAGVVTNTAAGLLSTAPTTGSGNIVRATSPSLVTPVLGDATATSINAATITATSSIVSNGDISAKRFKLTMPTGITATATTNIDMSSGNVFTVNLATNITSLTFTNPGVGTYLIKLVQTVGSKTVAFPVGWKWAGSVVPTITSTVNKLDIVTLIYDGSTYYATIVQNF